MKTKAVKFRNVYHVLALSVAQKIMDFQQVSPEDVMDFEKLKPAKFDLHWISLSGAHPPISFKTFKRHLRGEIDNPRNYILDEYLSFIHMENLPEFINSSEYEKIINSTLNFP